MECEFRSTVCALNTVVNHFWSFKYWVRFEGQGWGEGRFLDQVSFLILTSKELLILFLHFPSIEPPCTITNSPSPLPLQDQQSSQLPKAISRSSNKSKGLKFSKVSYQDIKCLSFQYNPLAKPLIKKNMNIYWVKNMSAFSIIILIRYFFFQYFLHNFFPFLVMFNL